MNDKLLYHDSETLKHINEVRANLWKIIRDLDERAKIHDASKMQSPEREIYADNTSELIKTEYGTPAYHALLEHCKPAIEHHYANNRHHPEHWEHGMDDMSLVDLIELVCDWKAATKRNKNGNILKSIDKNADRFKISPQLQQIMRNTVRDYFAD